MDPTQASLLQLMGGASIPPAQLAPPPPSNNPFPMTQGVGQPGGAGQMGAQSSGYGQGQPGQGQGPGAAYGGAAPATSPFAGISPQQLAQLFQQLQGGNAASPTGVPPTPSAPQGPYATPNSPFAPLGYPQGA